MYDPSLFQATMISARLLEMPGCPSQLCSHGEIIRSINAAYDMSQDRAEDVMQDIDEDDPDVLFSKIEEVGDLLDDTSTPLPGHPPG